MHIIILGDIIFYIKCFIIFSFLGFFFESFVYKVSSSSKHSGALHGPYTLVYGFGFTLNMFIFYFLNLKINFINSLFYYILFCIGATLVEFVFGHLINFLFHTDMWDYTSYKDSIGKYIRIKYFFIWGFISSFIIFLGNNFLNNFFGLISNRFIIFTIFLIVIDFVLSIKKNRD